MGLLVFISILIYIVIGGVICWIAGYIMKSQGNTLFNVIVGIVGSIFGSIVFSLIGLGNVPGWIQSIAGACLLIFLARLIKK